MRVDKTQSFSVLRIFLGLILLASIMSLAGCNTLDATTEPSPMPENTAIPTTESVPAPEETESPENKLVTLTLWIPPDFDPNNGSPQGEILQARLDEFTQRRSNVRIVTRVKNIEGPGSILDTLSTANAAAPLALPDLVALPHHSLEEAAIKGLLHPFDGLSDSMEDPDWYEFARRLSHLQNSTFGIPFAGDALILMYRPEMVADPPSNWDSLLNPASELLVRLSFPAADPNSLVTLALYQSTGGTILDEENRPTLDKTLLTEVLTVYQEAEQSSVIPYWLTQYENDDQSWLAYEEKQADMVITWASRGLKEPLSDTAFAAIPTQDGIPFTLATGWAWALASPNPDRQALSAQLAEFLTTSDFLSSWTAASGYIPPRPTALESQGSSAIQTVLKQVVPSSALIPSLDVVTTLGPVLQNATVDILKEQTDASTAADTAIEELAAP